MVNGRLLRQGVHNGVADVILRRDPACRHIRGQVAVTPADRDAAIADEVHHLLPEVSVRGRRLHAFLGVLDRGGDGAGYLILNREDVLEVPIVALRPEVTARFGRDQLGCHADPLAGLPHTAFDHVGHAEIAPYLLRLDRLCLIGERGVAGDHEQPADLGQ